MDGKLVTTDNVNCGFDLVVRAIEVKVRFIAFYVQVSFARVQVCVHTEYVCIRLLLRHSKCIYAYEPHNFHKKAIVDVSFLVVFLFMNAVLYQPITPHSALTKNIMCADHFSFSNCYPEF